MLRCVLAVSICLVVLTGDTTPLLAQARVTEDEFLSILTDSHPAVTTRSDRLGRARADRARAGLWPNPVVSFEREALRDAPEQTTWRIGWTPPFLDGRRGAAIRATGAGLQAATHDLEAGRLALRSDVRGAFAEWAIADERQIVLDEHLQLIERLRSQMQARARSGEESGLAARRLALVALEVQAEAAQAEVRAIRARGLARVWKREVPVDAQAQLPSLPVVSDTVITPLRSDVMARRFEVEEAEWQLRAGGRWFQFPELSFGWQCVRDAATDLDGPVVGVAWTVPLFDRRQPDRLEASARLSTARARLELASGRARIDLESSRATYLRLRDVALRGLETAAEAEQVEGSAAATFRLGESRLTDLLETLRSVLSARLAALDLYAAALEAHRDLELAAGRPLTLDGGSR